VQREFIAAGATRVSRAGSGLDILILKKSRSDPEKTEICPRCCVLVVLAGLGIRLCRRPHGCSHDLEANGR
jgi:hypothetical protein